jgi:hypothetical protein
MLHYQDGNEVRVGDLITHARAQASVEYVIEFGDAAQYGLLGPGFMIQCNECGRVLIEPESADWEDVRLVGRGA